ncbi:MAG: hypothetical protein HC897_09065 [Thermoanaerobaculia bacterium]|nr:hypothetical protein [Thermoanaerobaculia bacterium]
MLQTENEAETARRRTLTAVGDALDGLRGRGEWADSTRRRPLLKALRALTRGRLPKLTGVPSVDAALAGLIAARDRLGRHLDELAELYGAARIATSQELERIVCSARFREAVSWQNRQAVENGLAQLLGQGATARRNSHRRQHEEVAAKYLQRYCVKNDTIGFFGPVGWARLVAEGDPVQVRPGPRLCESHGVYFESWCIDALASKLALVSELRPWLAPRLRVGSRLEGRTLFPPLGQAIELSEAHARLLAACDGTRTAKSIAIALILDPSLGLDDESQVYALLESFCARRWVLWGLDGPQELHPEQTLRKKLEAIPQAELRQRALAPLEELEAARDRVAHAAGDAPALDGVAVAAGAVAIGGIALAMV